MSAVSEGICDTDHVTWAEKIAKTQERDSHGNVQLSGTGALADFLAAQVKGKLAIKRVRADTFGYLQRSFAGLQSETDVAEARALDAGRFREGLRAFLRFGRQTSFLRMSGTNYAASANCETAATDCMSWQKANRTGPEKVYLNRKPEIPFPLAFPTLYRYY